MDALEVLIAFRMDDVFRVLRPGKRALLERGRCRRRPDTSCGVLRDVDRPVSSFCPLTG